MKDRKTAILVAAARVIARHGVRGLRLEELAAEAGISKALVYYHFGDRAGLLRHTLRFVGERAERAAAGGGGAGDPGAAGPLGELARRLTRDFHDLPEVRENSAVWGELRAGAVFDPELREELDRADRERVREVTDLLGLLGPRAAAAPGAALVAAAERLTVLVDGLATRRLIGILPAAHARELMRGAIAAEAAALTAPAGPGGPAGAPAPEPYAPRLSAPAGTPAGAAMDTPSGAPISAAVI
ncbi:TetR/AcrR family transcriptional regulator [Streptomyces sp. NPDC090025]|uniref:TetR/AcrR family transcriptional regulator n=1 Tax=Streptomyces sp. NPDC090025 TaxID=3365922 RepID=UPI0038337BCC